MEVQIQALKKNYGRKTVLDNLSLTIGNGMFGLLGRNDAGKTMLLHILSALLEPTSGTVTFDKIPLKDTRKIRLLIGFLPQEFSLYPNMPVWEIVRYLAVLSNIPAEVQRRRIPELLKRVNLWEDRDKRVRKLTGGMKRRLGIWRRSAGTAFCRQTASAPLSAAFQMGLEFGRRWRWREPAGQSCFSAGGTVCGWRSPILEILPLRRNVSRRYPH